MDNELKLYAIENQMMFDVLHMIAHGEIDNPQEIAITMVHAVLGYRSIIDKPQAKPDQSKVKHGNELSNNAKILLDMLYETFGTNCTVVENDPEVKHIAKEYLNVGKDKNLNSWNESQRCVTELISKNYLAYVGVCDKGAVRKFQIPESN